MRISAGKKILMMFLLIFIGSTIHLSAQHMNIIHEKTFDVKPGELLEIQSDVGDVDIKTWGNDEVYIKVFGTPEVEEEVDFIFEKTSKGVLIDAEKEGNWGWSWGNSFRLKYEIRVPETFDLDISTAGGDVTVLDVTGFVELRTSGGDLFIENVTGDLIAKTSGGDVELYEIFGNIEAKTSGGDVDIKSYDGFIDASTSGGDVKLTYKGENKGIQVGTSGGDIDVYVKEDLKADVYLSTSGGDVDCDLNAKIDEVTERKFVGKLNGGGPELTCKTSGGDVTVSEIR